MEFSFTDEQTMIFDTAEAFLGEVSEMASIRKSMETNTGYDVLCMGSPVSRNVLASHIDS
jgi:hypothetical protein